MEACVVSLHQLHHTTPGAFGAGRKVPTEANRSVKMTMNPFRDFVGTGYVSDYGSFFRLTLGDVISGSNHF